MVTFCDKQNRLASNFVADLLGHLLAVTRVWHEGDLNLANALVRILLKAKAKAKANSVVSEYVRKCLRDLGELQNDAIESRKYIFLFSRTLVTGSASPKENGNAEKHQDAITGNSNMPSL